MAVVAILVFGVGGFAYLWGFNPFFLLPGFMGLIFTLGFLGLLVWLAVNVWKKNERRTGPE
ncbi:MAG TPA: hypothetical protein VFQ69_08830 [Rhizomicrobium sp.]|nr:hypothetical protein [Rhizomicrobium sp.]